jgi:hypothetical protein
MKKTFVKKCESEKLSPPQIRRSLGLNKVLWGFFMIFWCAFLLPPAGAQEVSNAADANVFNNETLAQPEPVSRPVVSKQAPATIETRWDSLWGMKYFQSGSQLSGQQLDSLLLSADDPQISALLEQSKLDETLGTLGFGTSVAASLICLALPSTIIPLGNLKISLPYLPLQIPALAIGVAAGFFTNAAGAAKFTAVQRYNGQAIKPGSLTWNLTPESNGLVLVLNYSL